MVHTKGYNGTDFIMAVKKVLYYKGKVKVVLARADPTWMQDFMKANFNGLPLASLPDNCSELVAKKKNVN